MQAIDPRELREIQCYDSPARVFSPGEAEVLMAAYPPKGLWEGGYIRIAKFNEEVHRMVTAACGAFVYRDKSDSLVPVINPVDARFAIYEVYTAGPFYASYSGSRDFDAYLLRMSIRIVDLLAGEEIFSDSILSNPPPDELRWLYILPGPAVVDGKYYHNDFDFSKYAAVMEAHLSKK